MLVAVMQPHFMPYVGYYELMRRADVFVFYDTAQFCKQSWHVRNRFSFNGAIHYLSPPIIKPPLGTEIKDVKLDTKRVREWVLATHKTFSQAYGARGGSALMDALWFYEREDSLSEANIRLTIETFTRAFNWCHTATRLASDLECEKPHNRSMDKQERLFNIINSVGGTCYISPPGAREYLTGFTQRYSMHIEYLSPAGPSGSDPAYLSLHDAIFRDDFARFKGYGGLC